MSRPAAPTGWGRAVVALAGAAAAVSAGLGVWAVRGPSPPRDVAVTGGWSGAEMTCRSPVLWTGEVAYAACDWSYRRRALVELRPEAAAAAVVQRWETDDGNVPRLSLVQACGDGELFVIGETERTTIVRRSGGASTTHHVDIPGHQILGAACDGGVHLFAEVETPGVRYATYELTSGGFARTEDVAIPWVVLGAWREDGRWHVAVSRRDDAEAIGASPKNVYAGPIGGPEQLIGSAGPSGADRPCLVGAPGGWLFVSGTGLCAAESPFLSADGGTLALHARSKRALLDGLVYVSPPRTGDAKEGTGPRVWSSVRDANGVRVVGPARQLEMAHRDGAFWIQEAGGGAVPVAKSRSSRLEIDLSALPLDGGGVALWGGLGAQLVVLGPDLRRRDELSGLARLVRPWGRFKASSKSTLDQVRYFALLALTPAYLLVLVLAVARRQACARWSRRCAALYLVVAALSLGGAYRILQWI